MLIQALDRRAWTFLALLLFAAVAIPTLNLALEPGQTGHVPSFAVALMGKYLTYALLALSVDLVWGYCGILSLGHGAFFALGGYAMGMHLMREIGDRGVYANPLLPDFMVFLNWQELPWFWYGFDMFWFAALMVLFVPGLLAFIFGWFAFRSRVTGVYLSIITQAMTYALMLAFFRNDMGFGGNNGLTDFKDVLGFDLQSDTTRAGLFALSALALGLGFFVARLIVTSRAGKVLVSIRDAESRTRFLGYRVEGYKLAVFTVSAMMAGVAGALYVPQVGIINPGEFSPANSIEIVVWVAVGGRGTLVGAALGAGLGASLGDKWAGRSWSETAQGFGGAAVGKLSGAAAKLVTSGSLRWQPSGVVVRFAGLLSSHFTETLETREAPAIIVWVYILHSST
ncbi:MAG: urea ABC transporter permease subunit UrtC [Pseudomonadota bacterium]